MQKADFSGSSRLTSRHSRYFSHGNERRSTYDKTRRLRSHITTARRKGDSKLNPHLLRNKAFPIIRNRDRHFAAECHTCLKHVTGDIACMLGKPWQRHFYSQRGKQSRARDIRGRNRLLSEEALIPHIQQTTSWFRNRTQENKPNIGVHPGTRTAKLTLHAFNISHFSGTGSR